jgi:hypothetical protein
MKAKPMLLISAIVLLMATGLASQAETVSFSGFTWIVRASGRGGPGPNNWDQNNVRVDTNGFLHLRLTHRNDQWYCAEVYTQKRLGFGQYQFWLEGRVDKMDRNVVLGLFNYPTSDVGPDGTHEIDIEFAQWGNSSAPSGNYTVWPVKTSVKRETKPFSFALNGDLSTHRFTWGPTNVLFKSLDGQVDDESHSLASWLYQPTNPATVISQQPMPVHINLWCFRSEAPSNNQGLELIIRAFKFTPM